MKRNDGELEAQFEDFFQTAKTLDIDEAVFRRAAKLRAELGFKLPDALHVACAAHHGCDSFWTNDARLSRVANYIDIKIVG